MRAKGVSWVGVKTDSYPPEQFARNQVEASLLVDDFEEAIKELRTAGLDLLGKPQSGGAGYRWQHFRAPDGKMFELVSDPLHPSSQQSSTETA